MLLVTENLEKCFSEHPATGPRRRQLNRVESDTDRLRGAYLLAFSDERPVRTGRMDGQPHRVAGPLKQEQQLLTLIPHRHNMHRLQTIPQFPPQLGDIGHGRNLHQHGRAKAQKTVFQGDKIGRAVGQAEDFLTGCAPAGRVQENHIGGENPQDGRKRIGRDFRTRNPDVGASQGGKIVPGGIGEIRIHLIVQDFRGLLGKSPGIHAQATGQIGHPQAALGGGRSNILQQGGFVKGGGGRGALLPCQGFGINQRRFRKPLRNLVFQFLADGERSDDALGIGTELLADGCQEPDIEGIGPVMLLNECGKGIHPNARGNLLRGTFVSVGRSLFRDAVDPVRCRRVRGEKLAYGAAGGRFSR